MWIRRLFATGLVAAALFVVYQMWGAHRVAEENTQTATDLAALQRDARTYERLSAMRRGGVPLTPIETETLRILDEEYARKSLGR